MKIKFTAEIIDDDGNVVGKRTSEEGGHMRHLPSAGHKIGRASCRERV